MHELLDELDLSTDVLDIGLDYNVGVGGKRLTAGQRQKIHLARALLKRPDGRVAHIESEYNDIYITKRRNELTMSFQIKGWDYTESVANLADPDDLMAMQCVMRRDVPILARKILVDEEEPHQTGSRMARRR